MRKIVLLLISIFLLSSASYSQRFRSEVYFYKDSYFGIYSEYYEQPIWVSYIVDCTEGNARPRRMRFKRDYWIYTSDHEDYVYNIWEKGHLVPPENFRCSRKDMIQTFTYLNCALQHKGLNRGKWRELENLERKIARRTGGPVYVEVKVHFNRYNRRLRTGATIPYAFTKKICIPGEGCTCYFFLNIPSRKPLRHHIVDCKGY